jgi:hypothetical protein
MRFHFSATATESLPGGLSQAEIDLNVEISAKNGRNIASASAGAP